MKILPKIIACICFFVSLKIEPILLFAEETTTEISSFPDYYQYIVQCEWERNGERKQLPQVIIQLIMSYFYIDSLFYYASYLHWEYITTNDKDERIFDRYFTLYALEKLVDKKHLFKDKAVLLNLCNFYALNIEGKMPKKNHRFFCYFIKNLFYKKTQLLLPLLKNNTVLMIVAKKLLFLFYRYDESLRKIRIIKVLQMAHDFLVQPRIVDVFYDNQKIVIKMYTEDLQFIGTFIGSIPQLFEVKKELNIYHRPEMRILFLNLFDQYVLQGIKNYSINDEYDEIPLAETKILFENQFHIDTQLLYENFKKNTGKTLIMDVQHASVVKSQIIKKKNAMNYFLLKILGFIVVVSIFIKKILSTRISNETL